MTIRRSSSTNGTYVNRDTKANPGLKVFYESGYYRVKRPSSFIPAAPSLASYAFLVASLYLSEASRRAGSG